MSAAVTAREAEVARVLCGEVFSEFWYAGWCVVVPFDTWKCPSKRSSGGSAGIPFARYPGRHSPSPVPNAQADVQGIATGAISLVHSGNKSVEWHRVMGWQYGRSVASGRGSRTRSVGL